MKGLEGREWLHQAMHLFVSGNTSLSIPTKFINVMKEACVYTGSCF